MKARKQVALLAVAGLMSCGALAGELAGRVQWAQRVTLSTPVSGVVAATPVTAGDTVSKGQVVLRLDQRGFRAALQRAQAQLKRTTEARDEAQREYDRSRELYDRTLLSEHDLQMAEIANTTAQAEFAAAQAAVTEAQLALEYSAVRAPFAGVVLQRHTQVGETIVTRLEATPLVEMAATDTMRVRVAASVAQLQKLAPGTGVAVQITDRHFQGRVSAVALEPVDGDDDHYAVDVEFAPGNMVLRAGQSATVSW